MSASVIDQPAPALPRRKRLRLNPLVKKIHTYAGLLSFTIVFVWGITGLSASFEGSVWDRPPVSDKLVSYTVPPNLTDPQVSNAVFQFLRIPTAELLPRPVTERDDDDNLELTYYTANGPVRV